MRLQVKLYSDEGRKIYHEEFDPCEVTGGMDAVKALVDIKDQRLQKMEAASPYKILENINRVSNTSLEENQDSERSMLS